ncbi:hypothetical protein V8G54_018933 [Vigna mungo]|uniref:Uncharacterized protein n=1 Tax=Vigna mungo TaxID=3915 RepID=A0AAQ3NAH4_VIGMU
MKVFQNFQAAAAKGTDLWHALFAARTISSICPSTYTRKQSDLNSLYTCTKTLNKLASILVSHKTIMSRLSLLPFKIKRHFWIKIKITNLPKQVDIFRTNKSYSTIITCGTANLSRLAAYGIGTSAPAILSTGASR